MPEIRNFHEKLEKDLQRLTVEFQNRRENPEFKELPEREVVKKSLEVFQASPASQASEPAVTPAMPSSSSHLPSYLSGSDGQEEVKEKVERLVAIVFKEGIEKAVREAKKQSPFVADAFHDVLVDKLLPELKKRGAV